MKHIKLFEYLLNYNVEIFTLDEFKVFYQNFSTKHTDYNLKDKIHYFDYNDFISGFLSEKYVDSCRFTIAFNNDDILGICKFAYWNSSDTYAISYLSTNKDYFQKGVSKKILDVFFEYFSETYPNETLNFSGYSVDGWKYLRNNILNLAKKYNIKLFEKGVQYPGLSGHNDEFYDLVTKSKDEVKKLYGKNKYYD